MQVLRHYRKALVVFPVVTTTITAIVNFSIADISAQIRKKRSIRKYDPVKTIRAAIIGAIFCNPMHKFMSADLFPALVKTFAKQYAKPVAIVSQAALMPAMNYMLFLSCQKMLAEPNLDPGQTYTDNYTHVIGVAVLGRMVMSRVKGINSTIIGLNVLYIIYAHQMCMTIN
jgi:hypothetical protein